MVDVGSGVDRRVDRVQAIPRGHVSGTPSPLSVPLPHAPDSADFY